MTIAGHRWAPLVPEEFDLWWGRGLTSHHLIWNTDDDHVVYLVMHPQYEIAD